MNNGFMLKLMKNRKLIKYRCTLDVNSDTKSYEKMRDFTADTCLIGCVDFKRFIAARFAEVHFDVRICVLLNR